MLRQLAADIQKPDSLLTVQFIALDFQQFVQIFPHNAAGYGTLLTVVSILVHEFENRGKAAIVQKLLIAFPNALDQRRPLSVLRLLTCGGLGIPVGL